jgi:N-acetylglucosaminyldiphosphoundecaprenol N-acetyl-beta-D-mannosaminyltransferase
VLDYGPSGANGDVAVVAGIPTTSYGRSALVDHIVEHCRGEHAAEPKLLFDVNGHGVALYHGDSNYRRAIDAADMVHADGQAIVLASRLLCRRPIVERSATTDLILDAAARAEREGLSFFLLGGEESLNAECAAKLVSRFPRLRIAGRQHGFFDDDDEDRIAAEINASGADIVWIGLGKPLEQLIAVRFRHKLRCSWVITCGGCFNFVAGRYARAPLWMQNAGLEWLHRALSHPRFFWRYLTTNPVAVYWIIRQSH